MDAPKSHDRSGQHGLSLIELMVALGIGMFLIVGALTVYAQSRSTYRINESIARLQENGRYFFDVVEPDIRMAGYWGLASQAAAIGGRAEAGDPVSPLSPGNDCGPNWTVNLAKPAAATNNAYTFACPAYGAAAANADTLVVRRASAARTDTVAANSLYIRSSLANGSEIVSDQALRERVAPEESEIRELIVNGYYVSRNSSLDTADNSVPSLRRKLLRHGSAGGPVIVDEEVLPGVEDLQVKFGIDTDRPGDAGHGVVDRYLDPSDPILDHSDPAFDAGARILAVRVWLRLRSERPEPGLPEDAGFSYADQIVPPINDGFRRIVVAKTIFLRNLRTAT